MWAEQAARKFRAFLYSVNRLTTRKDPQAQARRNTLEGEAAKVGLELEERESKGPPKHTPAATGDKVNHAD
jgi:hypothetical protein